jgi:hypothetical protein
MASPLVTPDVCAILRARIALQALSRGIRSASDLCFLIKLVAKLR